MATAKRSREPRPTTALLAAARRNRHKVIHERNLLILALAKHAGFDCHLVKTATGKGDEWNRVVCLHTPAGQLHWKLSPDDQKDFDSLDTLKTSDYDGADHKEKQRRLEELHTLPAARAAKETK